MLHEILLPNAHRTAVRLGRWVRIIGIRLRRLKWSNKGSKRMNKGGSYEKWDSQKDDKQTKINYRLNRKVQSLVGEHTTARWPETYRCGYKWAIKKLWFIIFKLCNASKHKQKISIADTKPSPSSHILLVFHPLGLYISYSFLGHI